MNADVKAQWIEALEGGTYQQGRSYLRTEKGKFCCLGVLCDIHRLLYGTVGWDALGSIYTGEQAYPPAEVMEWAGLAGSHMCQLASDNDKGQTFFQIAETIRRIPSD